MIYLCKKFQANTSHSSVAGASRWLMVLAGLVVLTSQVSLSGELRITPDDNPNTTREHPSVKRTEAPWPMSEPQDSMLEPGGNGPSRSTKEPDVASLIQRRIAGKRLVDRDVDEEERFMREAVQIIDRDTAMNWMAAFISSKPLNCPQKEQAQWIEAIISAVERNGLPVSKEMLALVATIISIESGFRVDPQAVDPSRGEDIFKLLERAETDLHAKFGRVMSIPPLPQLYRSYRDKYYPRLLECQTEGQIEVVAQSMADDLQRDIALLPRFLRSIIAGNIDKLVNVVRTKGSMQLNFPRARQVMKERGETFTDKDLTDYIYTIHGGVDVGVAALKPMFVQYAARYAVPANLSWLFFIGMDYNYGPFSSRNMMEQIRIRDLSGRTIAIDGDFMHYDDKARPEPRDSETLQAVMSMLPSVPKSAIVDAFLLEKDPHYIYTEVHEMIVTAHRDKFGETPFAVIGELWMGENAKIKHGTTWKTQSYLNKLDRYLNSVPWDL